MESGRLYSSGTKKICACGGATYQQLGCIYGLCLQELFETGLYKIYREKRVFKPPYGFMFRKLGGVPVDRFSNNNFVEQVVDMFNSNESFAIALSPEGTRKKVDRLRTGFYHIAKSAGVPIVLLAFDFERKEFRFAAPFYATENEAADVGEILSFFKNVMGKNPHLGLSHLSGILA